MTTLSEVSRDNPGWFSRENMDFFGDLSYGIKDSATGKSYLVRKTNAWTDMFDGVQKPHYRLNTLTHDGLKWKIGPLVEESFKNTAEVDKYLEEH